jgi:hypothetical protein
MEPPASKPRRWFQFSLRTLLVIMLLVAAFFGGRESLRPTIRAEQQKAEMARAKAELALALATEQAEVARAAELLARKEAASELSAAAAAERQKDQ